MSEHIKTGKLGEAKAVEYLRGKNYRILEQNWRSGHKEIDIIAEFNGELIIVEVKVRKSIGTERLEEHITGKKQKNLIRAAEAYLRYKNLDLAVRFDIILIAGEKGQYKIEQIENAFTAWDY
jgi:putative endonuclease